MGRAKGSALLSALFIMTLVAIVATAMSTKLQLDIHRTKLLILRDRLYLASEGVRFWALNELKNSKKTFRKVHNQGRVSQFPKDLASIYPNVKLTGGLYDLQSKYNLNNLRDRKASLGFINFLNTVAPKATTGEKVRIAFAINNWLSGYSLTTGKDHYLTYYLKQKPPYYPSHQLMASASELRLVEEVSASLYLALEPYITALPEQTPLNINTASQETLLSLGNSMTAELADKIIETRGKSGLKSLKKIDDVLKKGNVAKELVTIDSTYFLSIAEATSEDSKLQVYTVFKKTKDKKDKKDKITVTIIYQSFNEL